MIRKTVRCAVPAAVLLFLYFPILMLAFYSLTDATQIGTFRAFTMKNYATLFTTEELRNMIFGTILLALGSALIATILGTLGAVGSFYSKKRTSSAMATVNQIPVINADVVTGFSLAVTLSLDDYFIATYTKPATFDTISTYVVNATKGSQTQIKTALWALSTLIFLRVIVIVLVMNISSRRTAQKEDRL